MQREQCCSYGHGITFEGPSSGIHIRATAKAHSDIADDLLAIHGLSGADTVASLHGIDNATVIRISKTGGFSLQLVTLRLT